MPASSVRRSGPDLTTVLLLAAFSALAPMAIDMYLPGVPAISADLAASPWAASATLSVFFAGLALGQLFAGPWSDRIGRRTPIRAGLALFVAGAVLAAAGSTIGMLLAGRLLQAFGASAVMVTGRAVVRDIFDERGAARFFSSITLVSGLAPVLAPSVGAVLLLVAGWRAIFLTMACFAGFLLVVALGRLGESRSAETARHARENHPLRTYATLLANRRFLGYMLAAGCNSGCYFTFLASAPLVLMKGYGLSSVAFSLVIGINAVGLVGMAQLNRLLLRTRSPSRILRGSARNALFLAALFAALGATRMGGLPALLIPAFAVIASTSVIQANTMASALSIVPSRAGAAAALVGSGSFGMGTAMSLLAGMLYDGTAAGMIAVMTAGLVGTAASLLLLALPERAAA